MIEADILTGAFSFLTLRNLIQNNSENLARMIKNN